MSAHTRRRFRPVRTLAAAALLLGVAGCASAAGRSGSANPFGQTQGETREIRILVRNLNYNDATVWTVVRDARRERLGLVTGKSDTTFTVPWTFTDALRLEFDLIGGVRCMTEPLSVDPGEIIELQISVDPSQDPMCR
ncbi:MAG TPA: hypothetical protein VLH75_09525 [Longimicrobiales bacterium]|nr:hypothetical protein [Longimicrobiales bacterium]